MYSVTSDEKEAQSIGRDLVASKLAACVNIYPHMKSIYRWKGEVTEDSEAVLIIKTRKQNGKKVMERVVELHSYECPCILEFEIKGGFPDYLSWLESETEPDS